MRIPGWLLSDFDLRSGSTVYETRFGDLTIAEPVARYGHLRASIHIARPVTYFLWKLMLPLTVVVCASLASFLLRPNQIDARIGLPLTALLTAVFLQQAYTADLPELGYMVLMDKIYALAYVLIMIALGVTVVTANWSGVEESGDDMDEILERRLSRLDHIVGALLTAAFVGGLLAILGYG